MGLRKNQASLTLAERLAFTQAVLSLKNDVPSQLKLASRYDDFVSFHFHAHHSMTITSPGAAHRGPAFLPWHREYLRRFELELQMIDSSVTIPYWDWTVDSAPAASIWAGNLLGGDGDPADHDIVRDGYFGRDAGLWTITLVDPQNPATCVQRTLGREVNRLPNVSEVRAALAEVPYYSFPWRAFVNLVKGTAPTQPSFCNRLEGNYGTGNIHNQVHLWIGGTMNSLMGSPNDPAFWLVHSNIDRLWAQWQALHPEQTYRPSGSVGETGPYGHNLNDPMHPWGDGFTPASVLSHVALGYWYDSDAPALIDTGVALARLPPQPAAMAASMC